MLRVEFVKASEMIVELQRMIDKHGNFEIRRNCSNCGIKFDFEVPFIPVPYKTGPKISISK